VKFARELNGAELVGVRFVPIRFTPTASIFKGKACHGVYILVTDRDALNAVDVGVTLALTLQRHYPNDFALEKVGRLLQHETTIAAIQAGNSLAEIKKLWAEDLEDFKKRRERFIIYQSR